MTPLCRPRINGSFLLLGSGAKSSGRGAAEIDGVDGNGELADVLGPLLLVVEGRGGAGIAEGAGGERGGGDAGVPEGVSPGASAEVAVCGNGGVQGRRGVDHLGAGDGVGCFEAGVGSFETTGRGGAGPLLVGCHVVPQASP